MPTQETPETPQEILYHFFIDRATNEELDEYGYIGLGDGQAEDVLKELNEAGYVLVHKSAIQEWITLAAAYSVTNEYPVKYVYEGFLHCSDRKLVWEVTYKVSLADWLRSLLKPLDNQ